MCRSVSAAVAALGLWLIATTGSAAYLPSGSGSKSVPECGASCTWSVEVDGVEVGGGAYQAAEDGALSLGRPWNMDLGGGAFVSLGGVNGNIDPILGFNASAGTGALGKTFAFSFSLPIALSGPIVADSSVSYSLTALSAAGAQIAPLFGKIVIAQEVDTSVGGFDPLNKGVDVGEKFFFTSGPQTQNSPVYTAFNSFTGDLAYDLMSVTIAFSLSPNSQVGLSGFVRQELALIPEEIPEPSTYLLLLAGIGLLVCVARRRRI